MIAGQAPMALAIMWSLTAITLVFVVLRFYTRAIVLRQVGWDDHTFVLSGVSLWLSDMLQVCGPRAVIGRTS